ncbi:MAG: peptidase M48 Ste24p [Gammaproteobacteria bacterium]|nr:peptidase M48 Ste24p [Gammaproteobacteria bacterium]
MTSFRLWIVLTAVAVLVPACATNPVSGRSEAVLMSEASEIRTGKQLHVQITQTMGVYDDLELQDYVQQLGARLAAASHRPKLEWKFTIVDTDNVNAFATPGGYVYISRGILPYLQSEAELAAVLGHEIAHITARHAVQQQSRAALAGIASVAAAIFTGQQAVGDLTNVVGSAIVSGYGREAELEADRLGAEYLAKTGYDPDAIIRVVASLKDQELFERERARLEQREPRIYHGVFATHPDNDTRLRQAVAAAGRVQGTGNTTNEAWFLKAIDGIAVGSSRRQGMVRDNRFYHADLQFTLAFPAGWKIQNEPQQILASPAGRAHMMQVTAQAPPAGVTDPRQFAVRGLANRRLERSQSLSINGLDAFTTVVRGDASPYGNNSSVRYVIVYHANLMWIIKGASRAGDGVPEGDRLFLSSAQTFRPLRSNEFSLAEPHRLQLVRAAPGTTYEALAKQAALPEYAVQQLRLFNRQYPSGQPEAGRTIKTVK